MTDALKRTGIAAGWTAAFLAVVLALGACTGQQLSDRQKLLAVCDTYTSTLNALASQRQAGNLTEQQIETVNNVRAVMNPICRGGVDEVPVESVDEALATAETQLFKLQGVKNGG